MTRAEALAMLKDAAEMWGKAHHPPSLTSYWEGKVAGVRWAIQVLESEDGDVA